VAGHEAGHAVVAWHFGSWPRQIRVNVSEKGSSGDTDRLNISGKDADIAISMAGYAANTDLQGVSKEEAWRTAGDDIDLMRGRYSCSDDDLERGAAEARRILDSMLAPWEKLRDFLNELDVMQYDDIAMCINGRVVYPPCSKCGKVVDIQVDQHIATSSAGRLFCGLCTAHMR